MTSVASTVAPTIAATDRHDSHIEQLVGATSWSNDRSDSCGHDRLV